VYKGEIYALGGEKGKGILDTVEVFFPETGNWSIKAPMPWGAADIQAGVIGNMIYIPGGRLASGDVSSTLSIFDPMTGVWTRGANLPAPVSSYALAVFEDNLYLFGGWDGEQFLDKVLRYDPESDEWSEGSNLNEPRADAAAVIIDDEIHLLGGFNQDGALDLYQVYAPSQEYSEVNPWRQEDPLPEPRSGMGAAAVIDVIYLVGGQGSGVSTLPTWGYLTKTKEWLKIPAVADENISELRLVLLDTEIYALGGQIGEKATNLLSSFQVLYITVLPFVP
jgi:N-acetylneuraminic acid mutarotase